MKGQDLKLKLKALRMNQIEFASKCGISEVQVSKWINGHTEVPDYAETIIGLFESGAEATAIMKLTALADLLADGHYTICKFTTNYRVSLGTPADREFIDKMSEGASITEAITNLLEKVKKTTS